MLQNRRTSTSTTVLADNTVLYYIAHGILYPVSLHLLRRLDEKSLWTYCNIIFTTASHKFITTIIWNNWYSSYTRHFTVHDKWLILSLINANETTCVKIQNENQIWNEYPWGKNVLEENCTQKKRLFNIARTNIYLYV